jgi:ubiquinone/menaquinone biosynthesis C-methylase UbiE
VADEEEHDNVRRSYDALAERYSAELGEELVYKPLDRALLAMLVEQLPPDTPIADLGCGPGHVAAWLSAQGVPTIGIDMSPGMVAVGSREHPEVEFRLGDLLSLPASDNEFGSAVAFYSIIHLMRDELGPAFSEVRRVLVPGGRLLLAFHVGDEVRHVDELWGQSVDLDFRFLDAREVVKVLHAAGFDVEAQLERTNYPEEVETRRAYLLARRR